LSYADLNKSWIEQTRPGPLIRRRVYYVTIGENVSGFVSLTKRSSCEVGQYRSAVASGASCHLVLTLLKATRRYRASVLTGSHCPVDPTALGRCPRVRTLWENRKLIVCLTGLNLERASHSLLKKNRC